MCCSVQRRDVFQCACDDVIRRERPHRQIPEDSGANRNLGGSISTSERRTVLNTSNIENLEASGARKW